MAVFARILLTGVNGQLGQVLQHRLAAYGTVIAADRALLDLADADAIRRIVREVKPDLIVNPAAYTAVDLAESQPELAYAVNAAAPRTLAEEAARLAIPLIHYSTDYVFDGSKNGPYLESDPAQPLGVYGKSKLEGEQAIRAVGLPHLILRTSWVFGPYGKNFMRTILRLALEREQLRVVSDQFGAPTSTRAIADATGVLIEGWQPAKSGTYHMSCGGRTSWHGFAQAITAAYSAQRKPGWPPLKLRTDAIEAITTEQYPLPAPRPHNSVLDNTRLLQQFDYRLPVWQQALTDTIMQLPEQPA